MTHFEYILMQQFNSKILNIFIESIEITSAEEFDPEEFYGSKYNEIKCLENKLQSEFDTFRAVKNPVLWPGMAFNLSIPGNLDNIYIVMAGYLNCLRNSTQFLNIK